ncbi:IS5/IS1182 family transposase [Streptomyces bottropensis]|uniref:IS5/IS1182 family transposase n=1 Tax=Streptomyces bottropensis TaxID=42235 RepID=UPI00378842C3
MTNTKERAEDTGPVVYQCRLPLSTRTVNHLADLLRRHLKAIRSRWRILPPGRIAVIVLAELRHYQRLADMAGGNDVSESTVRRRRDELIRLLADQTPRLDRALRKVTKQGEEVVLVDGTLVPTQRRTGKANRRNHSGKNHHHGLHFLALTDERGRLIWISAPPGPAAPTTSPPPATTTSWLTCAPLVSGRRQTSASVAWTTTFATPWSSPASPPAAPTGSALARRPPIASSPSDVHPSSTAPPTSSPDRSQCGVRQLLAAGKTSHVPKKSSCDGQIRC